MVFDRNSSATLSWTEDLKINKSRTRTIKKSRTTTWNISNTKLLVEESGTIWDSPGNKRRSLEQHWLRAPLPTVLVPRAIPSPHCLSRPEECRVDGIRGRLEGTRGARSTECYTVSPLSYSLSYSLDEHLLELYGENFVSSHEVSPRFL